jgi:hypothetical protein
VKALLRFLAYAAIFLPVALGAFIAGVVFERQRLQNGSLEQPATLPGGRLGSPSKAEQDPAPYQASTAPKEQQDSAAQGKQAARQQRIDKSMRAIEAAWRDTIEAEHLLAVKIGTCYGARFIRRGANVRVDLAKIDGVAVVGVIRISGMTAGSQPAGKDSCYPSITHALNASRRSFENLDHVDAKLTYRVKSSEIQLDSVESEPGWLAIAINDNIRLGLGSWRAVSIQPLDPE